MLLSNVGRGGIFAISTNGRNPDEMKKSTINIVLFSSIISFSRCRVSPTEATQESHSLRPAIDPETTAHPGMVANASQCETSPTSTLVSAPENTPEKPTNAPMYVQNNVAIIAYEARA